MPDLDVRQPVVLFLCVHNAGRSQMALGWFNHLADGRAIDRREPHVGAPAIGVDVGVANRERDPLAVGRNRRIADPPHREHVIDRQALRGRRCDGRQEPQEREL